MPMKLADTAGVGIIGSAHRGGESAVTGDGDPGGGGGCGDLGGSDCTGEDEGDDCCANDDFHDFSYPYELMEAMVRMN